MSKLNLYFTAYDSWKASTEKDKKYWKAGKNSAVSDFLDIETERLDEATFNIWRYVYRNKVGLDDLKINFLKCIDDLKMCHDNNEKYIIYCKWVQIDGFVGAIKMVHELDYHPKDSKSRELLEKFGIHDTIYPVNHNECYWFQLFQSKNPPKWLIEDLERGNCKIILHNILEEFTSRGFDAYFKTIQNQLKQFNLKEKYITIVDCCYYDKEYIGALDTEINFVYSNILMGFFIESEVSEIKKENLPNKPNTKRHRDKYFISLNRNAKLFRALIVFNLWKNNLLNKGNVSLWIKDWWIPRFNNDANLLRQDILIILRENGFSDIDGNKFIDFIFENDLSVDDAKQFERDGNPYPNLYHISTRFTDNMHTAYKNSYFSITSCNSFGFNGYSSGSNFYIDEKLFPAIIHFLPFILVGRYLLLREMKNHGFKTFHPHIDERYDEVEDPVRRMQMVMSEVNRLCSLSEYEIHSWYCGLSDILQYNYDFYFDKFLPLQVNNFYDQLLLEE